MDTSVIPPKPFFTMEVDGAPHKVVGRTWVTDRTIGFSYNEAALDPSTVRIQFPVLHPNLKTALGVQQCTFDQLCQNMDPKGEYEYEDPDLLVEVSFPVDMNTGLIPDTDEMNIYVAAVLKEPDSINWKNDQVLELHYAEGALVGQIDVQLPAATPNLVCAGGSVLCPFRRNHLDAV